MADQPTDEERGLVEEMARRLDDLINKGLMSGEGRRVTNQLIENLRARSFADD